jgi:hypothetical protein
MSSPSDLETRLRATLRERADAAPSGALVAERVLAEIEAPGIVVRPRGGFAARTMPFLAAAAVAAVIAGVVGISQLRHPASPRPSALSAAPSRPTTSAAPTSTTTHTRSAPVSVGGFRATDLTFASETHGWALGTQACRSGTGRCTTLFQTTDGATWHALPTKVPDVAHIRFANDGVGYAFSLDALFMTTDGGKRWVRQPGRGAAALETLDNNVIRVVPLSPGCPCDVRVETARIGSTRWTPVPLGPAPALASGVVAMTRSGSDAYVLLTGHSAGGALKQTSTLYASSDDGASWASRGEPCPQATGDPVTNEVDSVAVAAAPKDTVVALCQPRNSTKPAFIVTSHNAGNSFDRTAGTIRFPGLLTGDPRTVLVAGGATGAYRSTNGGKTWQRISELSGSVSFVGFESPTTGRAITEPGRTVWTTRDGGRTWKPFRFR